MFSIFDLRCGTLWEKEKAEGENEKEKKEKLKKKKEDIKAMHFVFKMINEILTLLLMPLGFG